MAVKYINAGAGSGKTYKLTHMLSDMLVRNDNPVDASRIILTTFTKAAAGEFLRKAREVLIADGKPDKAAELDSATIGTVHSVCEKFVLRYWYRLGLTLPISVISEEDKHYYVKRTTENVADDNDVKFFADFAGKMEMSPDFWKKYLRDIIALKDSFGIEDIKDSCSLSCENIAKVFSVTKAAKDIEKALDDFLAEIVSKINSQNVTLAANGKEPKYKTELSTASSLLNGAPMLSKAKWVFEMTGKWLNAKKGFWKEAFNDDEYGLLNDSAKDALLSKELGDAMQECVKKLCELAGKWEKEYCSYKDANGLMDFNDLEQKFVRLLYEPEFSDVRDDIQSSYDVMMVDEFQDSNPVQIKIFKKLMELIPEAVFVGDKKQAIYGFRGTESSLVDEFVDGIANQDSLKKSFRSRPELVNASNEIFCKAFDVTQLPVYPDDPEAPYDGVSLFPFRSDDECHGPALLHWNVPRLSEKSEKLNYAAVGKRLLEMKNSNSFPTEVSFSDIAILLRNNTDLDKVVTAFREVGLPVSVREKSFIQWAEVQLLLAMLRYYVDRGDCGAKADILHLVKGLSTKEIILDRLKAADDTGWYGKDEVFNMIDGIRERTVSLSIPEILDSLILEFGMYDKVKDWGQADTRIRNIGLMADLARQYEQQCETGDAAPSIYGYLDFVLNYRQKDNSLDKSDTVKVLTYHSAKGLEWPVVVMSELDSLDISDDELWKNDVGGVHPYRNGDGVQLSIFPKLFSKSSESSEFNTVGKLPEPLMDAVSSRPIFSDAKDRKIKEERRLLYVGFTRAKDCLITLGSDKSSYTWPFLCGAFAGAYRTDDGNISLWSNGFPSICEDLFVPDIADVAGIAPTSWALPSTKANATAEKYISPSKLNQGQNGSVSVNLEEVFRGKAMIQKIKDKHRAECGSCIHNIFAAYDPCAEQEDMKKMAARIIEGDGLSDELTSPSSIIESIGQLELYLKGKYGSGERICELPFLLKQQDGTVLSGEMDLVWRISEKECVLIDYKSYNGIEDFNNPTAFDEYYGYAPQLKAYREALQADGWKVVDTLIYYHVQGRAIKFSFT